MGYIPPVIYYGSRYLFVWVRARVLAWVAGRAAPVLSEAAAPRLSSFRPGPVGGLGLGVPLHSSYCMLVILKLYTPEEGSLIRNVALLRIVDCNILNLSGRLL